MIIIVVYDFKIKCNGNWRSLSSPGLTRKGRRHKLPTVQIFWKLYIISAWKHHQKTKLLQPWPPFANVISFNNNSITFLLPNSYKQIINEIHHHNESKMPWEWTRLTLIVSSPNLLFWSVLCNSISDFYGRHHIIFVGES